MFERFDIKNLYYCEIEDIVPIGMENFGGCISIDCIGETKRYSTIVCLIGRKYYDINNLKRNINILKCPQMEFPITSKNNHLYIIDESTLVPYVEKKNISDDYIVLQRLPFGKNRLLK